ncbi:MULTISPECIES: hypothetical protein [unclassified Saccharibacter]|uniref:hypothetical protein n=1 Tax=unclassified Saccharibacter TaxID=2648722 RepID=UPI001352FBB1|nr:MULTISPECIES: hypothetical protein [unclassified Saccharibacter]MXV58356.1 hypothetical protein [Saccharibacter sp. EH70]MXV65800.1 hypothetical protein [Saccharibacter sp. EH60]
MKKALLAASMLALVGCSDPRGEVPYQAYKVFNSYGITRTEDMKAILSVLPIDNLDIGYTQEWANFRKVMSGIQNKEYTSQELVTLMKASQAFHGDDPANLLASPLFDNRFNSDIIIPSAKRLHNNENIENIILDNIRLGEIQIRDREKQEEENKRHQEALERQKEAEQRRRDEAEERQNTINRFGQDILDKCNGRIISFQPTFVGQDPYAYVGKCVSMELPQFMPPNLGTRQWIGPNALLSTIFFGEVANTFVVEADEHVKIGTPLVAIGVDPIEYQNGLGTLQTPVTFKVLRFY